MSADRTVRWDIELPIHIRGDELVTQIDNDSYRYVGIAVNAVNSDEEPGQVIALTLVEARDLHAALGAALAAAQFPTKS